MMKSVSLLFLSIFFSQHLHGTDISTQLEMQLVGKKENICSICLDPMNYNFCCKTECVIPLDDKVLLDEDERNGHVEHHKFHKKCIEEYVMQNLEQTSMLGVSRCPLCKLQLSQYALITHRTLKRFWNGTNQFILQTHPNSTERTCLYVFTTAGLTFVLTCAVFNLVAPAFLPLSEAYTMVCLTSLEKSVSSIINKGVYLSPIFVTSIINAILLAKRPVVMGNGEYSGLGENEVDIYSDCAKKILIIVIPYLLHRRRCERFNYVVDRFGRKDTCLSQCTKGLMLLGNHIAPSFVQFELFAPLWIFSHLQSDPESSLLIFIANVFALIFYANEDTVNLHQLIAVIGGILIRMFLHIKLGRSQNPRIQKIYSF